jgi:CDP-4-dehydro-6-deoxyglucose reductase
MFPKPRRALARLASSKALSPSVRGLELAILDDEPFVFVAGQYIDLFVPVEDGEPIKRSYSIASAPDLAGERIELAVTLVEGGPVSTAIHGWQLGFELEVLGPSGLFTRLKDPTDVPLVFVGTGTGLSPLRSMILNELRERPEGPPVTLLFGARTEADILWRDELEALAKASPRFRYEITLSRASEAWSGRAGYVQAHLRDVAQSAEGTHVYICGLTKMVTEVRELLKNELGFDRKQVHSERYD